MSLEFSDKCCNVRCVNRKRCARFRAPVCEADYRKYACFKVVDGVCGEFLGKGAKNVQG